MYIVGENPALTEPNTSHARKALQKLDFLVVQDIFPTETAVLADVILPSSVYTVGENPALTEPNTSHARKALQKLDFLVVQDIFPTETAVLADVILPAAAFAE